MKAVLLWALCIFLMPGAHVANESFRSLVPPDTDSVSVVIVSGDFLEGAQVGGESLQNIFGRVVVVQDSTELRSSRAIRNVTQATSTFTGSVRIVDRGDTLFADTLHYDEVGKIGVARGNVLLTDGEVTAYATQGRYLVEEKLAEYPDGLRLEDSMLVLTGLTGKYWTQAKRAEVAGNVKLNTDEVTLRADSLTHHRTSRVSQARGNVKLVEASGADSTYVFGHWAWRDDQAKHSKVTGNPLLMRLGRDSVSTDSLQLPDTLLVRGGELNVREEEDGLRHLAAKGNVRVWRQDMAAVADSMVLIQATRNREVLWFFGRPVIWIEGTQVSGDTIRIVLEDGNIDSLIVPANAFVAQEDSIIGQVNQLRGRSLTGTFGDDSTSVFVIGPNAEWLHFQKTKALEPDGAIEASADEAHLVFKGSALQDMWLGPDVQADRHRQQDLNDQLALEGFNWMPEERPRRLTLLAELNTEHKMSPPQ